MTATNIARIALIALLVFTATLAMRHGNLLQINSQLDALSPDLSPDPLVKSSSKILARDIERRFAVVLTAADEELLDNALIRFEDTLPDAFSEMLIQPENTYDKWLELVDRYRFNFLTDKDREKIKTLSIDTLVERAHDSASSFDSLSSGLPLDRDPFGYANRWLRSKIPESDISAFPQYTMQDGSVRFYERLDFVLPRSVSSMHQQQVVVEQINRLRDSIQATFTGVEVLRSGVMFHSAAIARASRADITVISSVSSVGILILLLFGFRRVAAIILPAVSILVGLGCGFFVAQVITGPIHILAIVFGAGLLGVAVDYALHFFAHQERISETPASGAPLVRALGLSLATSMIGYSAMAFAGIQVLMQAALFSVVGLLGAWLVVVSSGSTIKGSSNPNTLFQFALPTQSRWGKWVTGVLLGLIAIATLAFAADWIKGGDDPRTMFKKNDELISEEKHIGRISTLYEPGRYLIVSGPDDNSIFAKLLAMRAVFDGQTLPLSIAGLLPSPREQRASQKVQDKLYRAGPEVGKLIEMLGGEHDIAVELLEDFQEAEGRYLSADEFTDVMQPDIPVLWLNTPLGNAAVVLIPQNTQPQHVQRYAEQHEGIYWVDTAADAALALDTQRHHMQLGIFFAVGLVMLMLFLRYRDGRALRLLGVPLAGIATVAICLSAFNTPLNLFHTMGAFLVLGLGMDYVIFAEEMHSHPRQVCKAIVLSYLTSVLSFGLLSLSEIGFVSAFGLTLVMGNTVNIIGALAYLSEKLNKAETPA